MAGVDERREAIEAHAAAVRARLAAWGAVRSGPGSISWRVNREVVLIAGWGRAVLLQLAHPHIAAGVAQHSSFRGSLSNAFRRLTSTVGSMLALTFGAGEDTIEAAAQINAIHDRVSGHAAAGERYSAHDPELLRWVHVALLDSILLTHELIVGPLTKEERDRYCAEASVMEPLLDIPPGMLPRDTAALAAAFDEMLRSGRLAVDDTSRELARALLCPPKWWLLWPAFRILQVLTIGLLPSSVRAAYGFEWTAKDERALARWTAALRTIRGVAPSFLRHWPVSRRRGGVVPLPFSAVGARTR